MSGMSGMSGMSADLLLAPRSLNATAFACYAKHTARFHVWLPLMAGSEVVRRLPRAALIRKER